MGGETRPRCKILLARLSAISSFASAREGARKKTRSPRRVTSISFSLECFALTLLIINLEHTTEPQGGLPAPLSTLFPRIMKCARDSRADDIHGEERISDLA